MDLAITESWLDYLGGTIAIFATMLAVAIGIREWLEMRKRRPIGQFTPAFAQVDAVWEKPRAKYSAREVYRQQKASVESAVVFPSETLKEPQAANFVFQQVQKEGTDIATLSFLNKGGEFNLEKVQMGKFNELAIERMKHASASSAHVAAVDSLQFRLKGDDLENRTYQFILWYRDLSGRRYQQEISGLGTELPIMDQPVLMGM